MSAVRRPDIQGLRAVAVMSVLGHHTLRSDESFLVLGIDVFFVVSGFVITTTLLREMENTSRVSLSAFAVRRIRRILPASAVMICVVAVLTPVLGPFAGIEPTQMTAVAAATGWANVHLARFSGTGYFDPAADVNALLHTWSLSAEEQVYAVMALMAVAAVVLIGGRRRRIIWVVLLVVVTSASFAFSAMTAAGFRGPFPLGGPPRDVAYYWAASRLWECGVGSLLAFVPVSWGKRWMVPCGVLCGALVVVSVVAMVGGAAYPAWSALPVVAAVALVIHVGATDSSRWIIRALSWRPAQRLGDISYSVYLWNVPIIVFVSATVADSLPVRAAATLLSVAVGWTSWRLVESPVRRAPFMTGRLVVGVGALCVVTPLVGVAVSDVVQARVSTLPSAAQAQRDILIAGVREGCTARERLSERDLAQCTFGPSTGRTVVVVGDSNARHLFEGLRVSAKRANVRTMLVAQVGCSFVALQTDRPDGRRDDCAGYVAGTVADLVAMKPSVVVISNATDVFLDPDSAALITPDGRTVISAADRAAAWTTGLADVVRPLREAGIDVQFVLTIPRFGTWRLDACSALRLAVAPASCAPSAPLQDLEADRSEALRVERAVASAFGLRTIDLAPALCPDGECRSYRDGRWWWNDGAHLSSSGALALADELATIYS